ncbi:hypothetical protein [Acidiplasma cupricumulans]|uniref:hypothetical protein n=1 Tax=Acidiplasma cupricumulans TaxID=312540 RepID=UPI001585134E|nr:hypothetical protein [Acidiplasma cupricumulans]
MFPCINKDINITPVTAPIFPIIEEKPYDDPLNCVTVTSAGIIPTVAPPKALNNSSRENKIIMPSKNKNTGVKEIKQT